MKKPRLVTVPITTDPDLEAAVHTARQELDSTAENLLRTFPDRVCIETTVNPEGHPGERVYAEDQAKLEALEKTLHEAQGALKECVREYVFRPIGWKSWRALKAKYPSKDKDYQFDVDAITPELLKYASHEPRLSAGDVEDLLESEDWSEGEIMLLVQGAAAAQT